MAHTAETLIAPVALRREILAVRKTGYAINRGELNTGIVGVAVPVRSKDGSVAAVVNVNWISVHPIKNAEIKRYLGPLREAAQANRTEAVVRRGADRLDLTIKRKRGRSDLMSVTCGDLIKRGRTLYGPQTALIYEDKRFSFSEQAERMFRLANALLGNGITKQQRVAVLARNCSEYVEIFRSLRSRRICRDQSE